MIRGLATAAAIALLGCNATIHQYRRPPVHGRIVGGSEQSLAVAEPSGRRLIIPRQTITDIDHPGPGFEVVGAILAVAGAIYLLGHSNDCGDTRGCAEVVVPMIGGIALFFGGAEGYRRSEAAEADHSLVLEPPPTRPPRVARPVAAPPATDAVNAPSASPGWDARMPMPDGGSPDTAG